MSSKPQTPAKGKKRSGPKSIPAFFRRIDRRAEQAINDGQALLGLEKKNLVWAMVAVLSNFLVLLFIFNKDPATGYIPTTSDWSIVNINNLSSRDHVKDQDVINFVSKATRECLTFTYLQTHYEIRGCFRKYFSLKSEGEVFGILNDKFIGPAKNLRFDLNTNNYHAPAITDNTLMINGNAAWRVKVFLDFTFNTRGMTHKIQKWEGVFVVVNAFKTLKPEGFEIHSATLKPVK